MSRPAIEIAPTLRPYVRRIVIQGDVPELTGPDGAYRVLPGPYPVIGFQYRGRLDVVQGSGRRTLDRSGLTGLLASARRFVPRDDVGSVLVYLNPDGAFALLGRSMDELADQHVGLDTLGAGAAAREVEERLAETATPEERAALVQELLARLLDRSAHRPHPLLTEAARRILHQHGTERIGDLARDLGAGDRHLERLFKLQVGVTPKRFASLAQFDWVRQRLGTTPTATLAGEAGYADQAHLVRSFRAFVGTTPGQFQPDAVSDQI